MTVGSANQTVTVEGSTPIIDPTTASIGAVVTRQDIQELPLNLREVGALALVTPGTVDTSRTSLTASSGNGSGFNDNSYSGAGGTSASNLLLIDGMISRALNNGAFALNPPPDMVQEFKIQNNVYDVQFGLTSGTVMNLITQSGTNSIRGAAYDYLRNRDFDARNYFDPSSVSADRPEYIRNQFGANLGFPIHKNMLFGFLAYEGLRLAQANNIASLVPSGFQKQGNFSSLLTGKTHNLCGSGGPSNLTFDTGQLFDPKTVATYACPNGNTILAGKAIPSNDIGTYLGGVNNIDSIAQRVLSAFPTANSGAFFINETPFRDNRNQYDTRLDWNLSTKDLVFARYILGTADQAIPGPFSPFNSVQHFRGHNGVVGWTHTFSPTLLTDVRVGYAKDYLALTCQGCPRQAGLIESFGIAGLKAPVPLDEEYPNFTFSNFASWGDGLPGFYPDIVPDSMYEYEGTLTKILGRHTLTTGADLDFWQTEGVQDPLQVNGLIQFSGQYSDLAGESSAAATASDLADMELGYPSGGDYTANSFAQELHGGNWIGAFLQDSFRVNPNFILEGGFRWDYRRQPIDSNNQIAAFYPLGKTYQPGDGLIITAYPTAENDALCSQPFFISATGKCLVASSTQRSSLGFNANQAQQVSFGPGHGNFSPRVGFSLRPTGSDRLVIHAGAGVFLDLTTTNQLGSADDHNPVSTKTPTYITTLGTPPPLTNGVPTTTQQMFVNVNIPQITSVKIFFMPSPFYHTPTVFEGSLSVQTQLSNDWALEVAYIGNKGQHEDFLHKTFNQAKPGVGALQPRRPWPDFNQMKFDTYDGNSNYNAMTVKVTKRYSNGLSGLIGYTFAKYMDLNGGTADGSDINGAQDDNNLLAEYALADTNVAHRLVMSGVYQLPFGKGHQLLSRGSLENAVFGGWRTSGIIAAQTGFPFTVTSSKDFSNTNSNAPRPDRTCSGTGAKTLNAWFNPSCFNTTALQQALAAGSPRFGESGRNILTGPGLVDVDLSLAKRFTIGEKVNSEFRADVFNLFNHPSFSSPNAKIGTSTAGVISSTVPSGATGYSRELQLSLRVSF